MKTALLLFAVLIGMSCSQEEKTIHSFQWYVFKKIPKTYAYNKHRIVFRNDNFLFTKMQEFSEDTIVTASINSPEDIIPYTKEELLHDPGLFKEMKFCNRKVLTLEGDYLIDMGVKRNITEKRGDSIFCLTNDTLFLMKITSVPVVK